MLEALEGLLDAARETGVRVVYCTVEIAKIWEGT